jgi:hypothetical protein
MVCPACGLPACSNTAHRPPLARGGRAADWLFGRFISVFGRFPSLFGRFISLFDRLGNLPRSLLKHQRLGRVDAVLEGPKIEVFPVFSRRAGKGLPRPWRRS